MRYLTAGESHGKGLTAILDGFPSGVKLSVEKLCRELRRRQGGYGRGERMKIECDEAEITAGVIGGVTIGSPIAFFIPNRDYENWRRYTDPVSGDISDKRLTAVRPGHADLGGIYKYGFDNARPVLERASARETAARVGVGAICRQLLEALGIVIGSHVVSIGSVEAKPIGFEVSALNDVADRSSVRCLDGDAEKDMMKLIDECKADGDTLGGVVEVVVGGYPVGVGSYAQYDRKLDAILSGHAFSVQSVKSVSVGLGERAAHMRGSLVHDEIFLRGGKICRDTNNAGGIEGGISNGENLIIRAAVKPIPTLSRGLRTVDIGSMTETTAQPERSDCCAVAAASVVLENVLAFALADELLKVTGGDDFSTISERVREMKERKL